MPLPNSWRGVSFRAINCVAANQHASFHPLLRLATLKLPKGFFLVKWLHHPTRNAVTDQDSLVEGSHHPPFLLVCMTAWTVYTLDQDRRCGRWQGQGANPAVEVQLRIIKFSTENNKAQMRIIKFSSKSDISKQVDHSWVRLDATILYAWTNMKAETEDFCLLSCYPRWLLFCPFKLATKTNICHEAEVAAERYPCYKKKKDLSKLWLILRYQTLGRNFAISFTFD